MANDFYSDNKLEELFGRRIPKGESATFIMDAFELGWSCPENHHHSITFSEFKDHIWCCTCKKDYFTLLCPRVLNPFTTQNIIDKEHEKLKDLISEWSMERYKNVGATEALKALDEDLKSEIKAEGAKTSAKSIRS